MKVERRGNNSMQSFPEIIKYGGKGLAILVLVVILMRALIYNPPKNRNVFRLFFVTIVVTLVLAIAFLVRDFVQQGSSKAPKLPPTRIDLPAPEPRPKPPPSNSSMLEVRGRVTPIPKQAAYISIEGTTGRWPIDSAGEFSFKIPGGPREARVIVADGDHPPQSGYYFLSGEPISISLKW